MSRLVARGLPPDVALDAEMFSDVLELPDVKPEPKSPVAALALPPLPLPPPPPAPALSPSTVL